MNTYKKFTPKLLFIDSVFFFSLGATMTLHVMEGGRKFRAVESGKIG